MIDRATTGMASAGGGQGNGISTENEGTAIPLTWNKSCVSCNLVKRKCDGLRPCSRCLRKKEGFKCTYQKRKTHKPHKPHKPHKRHKPHNPHKRRSSTSERKNGSSSDSVPEKRSAGIPLAVRNQENHGGLVSSQYSCFEGIDKSERCRVQTFPATGLVSMRETAYLNDFFDCLGILPLANKRGVCETMAKMMTVKGAIHHPSSRGCGEVDQGGALHAEEDIELSGPSISVFWSAVALGALVTGQPTETVEKYARLARNALKHSKGSSTFELARAWTLMAQLDGFAGNSEEFRRSLHSAKILVHEYRGLGCSQELSRGLVELLQQGTMVKLFTECNEIAIIGSFRQREVALPTEIKINSSDEEAFLFYIYIHTRLEQAVHGCCDNGDGTKTSPEVDNNPIGSIRDLMDVERTEVRGSRTRDGAAMGVLSLRGIGAFAVEQLADIMSIAESLEPIAKRMLAVATVTERNYGVPLEHVRSAVEVLKHYPGLLRSQMGSHMAHRLASFLVALDNPEARALFDKVRAMQTRIRPPSSSPIPPFEKWQGVPAFCSNVMCRVMEAFFRLRCNSPKSTASTGDSMIERTHGEQGEHCGKRIIGDGYQTRRGKTMGAASPSRWGSIPQSPSNDPDDVTAFPAREASYAPNTIALTTAACNVDCDNGATSVEVPLGSVEPFGHTRMGSDSCGNNECIRLERSDALEASSPRIFSGGGEKQSTAMSMPEFHKGSSCNGSYIDTSSSSAAIDSSIVICPEDWLYVAEAMLDPNIN